jgi:hypothetical protein
VTVVEILLTVVGILNDETKIRKIHELLQDLCPKIFYNKFFKNKL